MSQRRPKLLNGTKAHSSWSFSAIHILSFSKYFVARVHSQNEYDGGLLSPDDNPIKIQGKKAGTDALSLEDAAFPPSTALHYQSFDYGE